MATRIPDNATMEWNKVMRKYNVWLHYGDIFELKQSYDTPEDAEISKDRSLRDIEEASEDGEYAEWAFPA